MDLFCALPVEAPQQDGAVGHADRQAQGREEARTLQRDVRPAHAQRLACIDTAHEGVRREGGRTSRGDNRLLGQAGGRGTDQEACRA